MKRREVILSTAEQRADRTAKFDSIGVGVTGAWRVRAHDSNVYVGGADGPGDAAAPAATFGPGPGGDQSRRAGRTDCGRQTEGGKGGGV